MVLKICDHVRSHVFRTVLATSVCGPGAYAPIEFVRNIPSPSPAVLENRGGSTGIFIPTGLGMPALRGKVVEPSSPRALFSAPCSDQ